jgi:hypothetical protein
MPLFLLCVVGITFLILTMAFRSIVVAAKAAAIPAIMHLLGDRAWYMPPAALPQTA